jgi:hypothetical protein
VAASKEAPMRRLELLWGNCEGAVAKASSSVRGTETVRLPRRLGLFCGNSESGEMGCLGFGRVLGVASAGQW